MNTHRIRLAGPWELLLAPPSATALTTPHLAPASVPQPDKQPDSVSQATAGGTAPEPAVCRCQLPFDTASLPPGHPAGGSSIRLRRGFHQPRGLTPESQVSLTFVSNGLLLMATLNDTPLVSIPGTALPRPLAPDERPSPAPGHTAASPGPGPGPQPPEHWFQVTLAIRPWLRPFNQLLVELSPSGTPDRASALFSVALEICEP